MVLKCCCYGCSESAVRGGNVTFHSFPKDELMRKRWMLKIRRKDFIPSKHHKVCSKHFEPECFDREKLGGSWLKKGAVPTIFDFTGSSMKRHPRKSLATEEEMLNTLGKIDFDDSLGSWIQKSVSASNRSGLHIAHDNVALSSLLAEGFYDVPFSDANIHGGSVKLSGVSSTVQSNGDKTSNKSVKKIGKVSEIKEDLAEEGIIVLDKTASTKRYRYIGDFEERDMYNPERALRALTVAKRQHQSQCQTIRTLKRSIRKLQRKVSSLSILNGDWTSEEDSKSEDDELSGVDTNDNNGWQSDGENAEDKDSQSSSVHGTKKHTIKVETTDIDGTEQDCSDSQNAMETEDTERTNVFSLKPTLEEIREKIDKFAKERDWDQFHQPRNLLLALIAEMGELSEIFQWRGEVEEGLPGWSDEDKEHLGEELSDVLVYLVRLSDKCGVDLPSAVLRKMGQNALKYPASEARGSSRKYTAYERLEESRRSSPSEGVDPGEALEVQLFTTEDP